MSKEKVKELDEYVQNNYNEIMTSAKTICKSYVNDNVSDIINDTYLKLRNKIERDGFKGDNYGGYFWISLKNQFGMNLRKEKTNKTVFINDIHYNDVDYQLVVDKILLELDQNDRSSQEYDRDLMEISEKLFKFVDREFSEKESYLFRNYYLIPKSTYKKLSERTGYSLTDCSLIIKSIKKSIRKNFINWYKENYNG